MKKWEKRALYEDFRAAHPDCFRQNEGGITLLLKDNEIAEAESAVASDLKSQGLPPSWAEVGLVHEDQYMTILRDAVRFPSGRLGTHFRVFSKPFENGGAVALPLFKDQVVLVKHYRHPLQAWRLEAPRGGAAPGETYEQVARREVSEEVGGVVKTATSLGTVDVCSSYFHDNIEMFLVTLSAIGKPQTEEGVEEIILLSVPELEHKIASGEITDGHLISCFARARLKGLL